MAEKLPIIYVRGFAGGTSGIDSQTDDPFYGFNVGSTHVGDTDLVARRRAAVPRRPRRDPSHRAGSAGPWVGGLATSDGPV
jgi:hypothetical protein